MPIIQPERDAKWAAAHTNLDFIAEISAGDINSVIIILKLPFKTTRLNETI